MITQFSKIFLVLFIFVGVFFSCTEDEDPTPVDPNPTDTVVVVPPDTTGTGDTTTVGDTVVIPEPVLPTAITVIGSDFATYQQVGSDFTGNGINLSQVEVPTEGENQIWDFSSYGVSGTRHFNFDKLPVPDSTSFTSATYVTVRESDFNQALTVKSFQGI